MNRAIVGLLLITALIGCTANAGVASDAGTGGEATSADAGGGGSQVADAGLDALPYCEFVDPSLGPPCVEAPNAIVTRCYDGGPCEMIGCIPNYADCNGQMADGCEIDVQNDPSNCGGCGNVCPDTMGTCANMVCL